MSKKDTVEIDRSDEIKKILQNTIDVWQREEDRARELMEKAQDKRSYAAVRLETYIKTGKLLPVDNPD